MSSIINQPSVSLRSFSCNQQSINQNKTTILSIKIQDASLLFLPLLFTTLASAEISCNPCIERSKVKVAVVDHGQHNSDSFWADMNGAILQGAADMGVELLFEPDENENLSDSSTIFEHMVQKIEQYCQEANAILSSLPDKSVYDALMACRETHPDVIVAGFNAGLDLAKSGGIQFWGQDENQVGYEAGAGLAKVETIEKFCCVNHAPNVDVLTQRCAGFELGVQQSEEKKANSNNVTLSQAIVDLNDCEGWNEAVLANCSPDEGKDWTTVGLFMGSNSFCPISFLQEHPDTYAAFTDVSQNIYDGMRAGLKIIMAIDQQSYLQGYFPFSHLTIAAPNGQSIGNTLLETGPRLVTEPPSDNEAECVAFNFKVCADNDDYG